MALSIGQINDAYQEVFGRFPTGDEVQRVQSSGLDGDPGKWNLIAQLSGQSPQTVIEQKQRQILQNAVKDQYTNINKYLEENPLKLDESFLEATRKLVEEQVQGEPYFQEKLSNYLKDVDTQRSRALEDTDTIINELNRKEKLYKTTEKMTYQNARESALEGQVDAGTLKTGMGQRSLNMQESARNMGMEDYLTDVEQDRTKVRTGLERTQEDLDLSSDRFKTDLDREKQLRIEQEILGRKQEELNRRSYDRQDYIAKQTGNLSGISAYL